MRDEVEDLKRPSVAADGKLPTAMRRGRIGSIASAVVLTAALSPGISPTPVASAEPAASVRDAVSSARGATSCAPLQYNQIVEQVAETINRTTDDYLSHTAKRVPITDPMEGLKLLGYGGSKAYLLQGANKDEAVAIKAALLEGYDAIPDCSYADYGVSMRRNERTGYNLASVVLARQ